MACSMLLACFLVVRPGHALLPIAYSARPVLSRSTVPRCMSSAGDDGDGASNRTDLSQEFSRFVSPRVVVTQSGPVRYTVGAAGDLRKLLQRCVQFYNDVLASLPLSRLILLLTLAAYAAQQSAGKAAMYAGARINGFILQGQWHRLFSPMFLHGSLMHLLSNSYSLWRLGPLAEGAFGKERLLLIYLLSGVGGNLLGLYYGSARSISVGASGAVFGLMGAVAAFALRNKRSLGAYSDSLLSGVGQTLLINLVLGTRRGSGIDNLGHVGGCLTGALVGLVLSPDLARPSEERSPPAELLVRVLVLATVAATALSVRETAALTQLYRAKAMLRLR